VAVLGVVAPRMVVPAVVVAGHVLWGAAHHGEHLAAAGAEEAGQQSVRTRAAM
jgi:hypothetical protein